MLCAFGLVGTKVDGRLTDRNKRIFFRVVRFVYPNYFRKKQKRNKCHLERILKVRCGCVRRLSDAKEVAARPSAWLVVKTVFKRLDSGDVKILNRA